MASGQIAESVNLALDEQRLVLALYITSITLFVICLWQGLRRWVPAISLAIQVLTMNIGGKFL